MRCLITRCPNGFSVCCQTCECADFCKDKCSIKRPCQAQISTNPEELEIKEKRANPFKEILNVLVLCISLLVLGSVANVMVMQTDTLNAINDTRLEIDVLSEGKAEVEQVDQSEEKTVTRGVEERSQLSQSEQEYIERVCMAECRGGGVAGMAAVAQVISDRANLWNMTPLEVASQQDQFAEPYMGEISAEAVQAVWAVFDENMKAFEDNNVTHFYAEDSQEPYWTDNKEFVGSRGGNRFYESRY